MKRLLLSFALVFAAIAVSAQATVGGEVVDSVSGKPLAKVVVSLLRGGKTIKFARTDAKGRFSFAVADVRSGDQLQASSLGYRKKRIGAAIGSNNTLQIVEQAFQLREVVVRSAPVTSRRDTITYDLTRYATDRDNTLKDVLRKLPGVNVDKQGKISYNGKDISRFTVEGLDLSNGRYNQLTDNIKARDVKKAEVVEHDQPIKALKDKVTTDNIAMNVELKDSVRDKFTFTLRPYVLVGDPNHVGGSINVMQMGKKRQMMYGAAYDRTGDDISNADITFFYDLNRLSPASVPSWLTAPSLTSPIDMERLRFNTSQRYNASYLTKPTKDTEERITVAYSRSVERQHTASTSIYYMEGSSPTSLTEDNFSTMITDQLQLDYKHTLNSSKSYGTLDFCVNAKQSDGLSQLQSTGYEQLTQRVRIPVVDASASIYKLYTLEKGTLSWKSMLDYHHSRNDLYLDAERMRLTNNLWHTAHELTWLNSRHYLRRQYTVGMDAENLNVVHSNVKGSLYFRPFLTYERGSWIIRYSQSWKLVRYVRQKQTVFNTSPFISVNWKPNSRSEWRLYTSYNRSNSGWKAYALDQYRTNYHIYNTSADFIPTSQSLSGSLNYTFRRPIYELFFDATLQAGRNWQNAVTDMTINNGNYYYTYLKRNTQGDNVQAALTLSKGFFGLNLKTSLGVRGSYLRGEQYANGELTGYSYRNLSLEPEVLFSPKWMQLSYNGSFSVGKSSASATRLSTIFNHTQRLSLTSTIQKVDLTLSGVYYHNEIMASPSVNTLLADAKVVWRMKRVRLRAELTNIFNKKTYAETSYSGIGSFTNSYILRPRELKLSAQFSL